MGILQTIGTEAKTYFAPLLFGALVPAVLSQFDRAQNYLVAKLKAPELGTVLILETTILLALLSFASYLLIKFRARASPNNYKPHQPCPGVTVYMEQAPDPRLQFQLWYCPRCLNVDHKIGVLTADPSGDFVTCERCTKQIHLHVKK